MTRLEIFRGLSDEGVATLFCCLSTGRCEYCRAFHYCRPGHNGMLDWLKGEVPDEDSITSTEDWTEDWDD